MKENEFNFVFLGQSILRYKTPKPILDEINSAYERLMKKKKLLHMRDHLAGKIYNEHALFWNSQDESRMKKHNVLSESVINFFKEKAVHYLKFNRIKDYQYKINSIWVNEMKAGEYNPIHAHSGDLLVGLSSVMFLKIPKSYGKEYTKEKSPSNGQLNLLGNVTGHFCKSDYVPRDIEEGDFILFPYDIRHCVYPFRGQGKRRTLSANLDVLYNPFPMHTT